MKASSILREGWLATSDLPTDRSPSQIQAPALSGRQRVEIEGSRDGVLVGAFDEALFERVLTGWLAFWSRLGNSSTLRLGSRGWRASIDLDRETTFHDLRSALGSLASSPKETVPSPDEAVPSPDDAVSSSDDEDMLAPRLGWSFAPPASRSALDPSVLEISLTGDADASRFCLDYEPSLFDRVTVERLWRAFDRWIGVAVATPDRPIAALPLLSKAQRFQMLVEWQGTSTEVESGKGPWLPRLLAEKAERQPAAIALVAENGTFESRDGDHRVGENGDGNDVQMSFACLMDRADSLARGLRAHGVEPEAVVGLLMERSTTWIESALAVLLAGGAYLPLDPSQPEARLKDMIEDACPRLVLTSGETGSCAPSAPDEATIWTTVEALKVDAPPPNAPQPDDALDGEQLAYVIYTSGSTGRPKGVEVRHAGLLNLVLWHQRTYALKPGEIATQVAAPGFDAAVWEVWPRLAAGLRLEMPSAARLRAPSDLLAWLNERRVERSFLPTPLAEALLQTLDSPADLPLHVLLTGGDKLHRGAYEALAGRLFNHYGPTEATVVTSWEPVRKGQAGTRDGAPAIGRPLPGFRVRLLDAGLRPVALGCAGELTIGGLGLARGYRYRPAQTATSFVPEAGTWGGRLYRTGDLARHLADGRIEFLGRIDRQVKVRGFRIELGEIEAVLQAFPEVREAAVLVRGEAPRSVLVAYAALTEASRSDEVRPLLRRYLTEHLPEYMVPSEIVFLPRLPLTPNGKLDRRALPDLAPRSSRAPRSREEQQLAEIFADVLDLDPESIVATDDFFALGGHSLLVARALGRVKEAFDIELTWRDFFDLRTIETLAKHLAQGQTQGQTQALNLTSTPVEPQPADAEPVLSFVQERFVYLDQLEADPTVHSVPARIDFEPDQAEPSRAGLHDAVLDEDRLRRAWQRVVERHAVLRTSFPRRDGRPRLRLAPVPPSGVSLPTVDLSGVARAESEIERLIQIETDRPFDLANGPLWRAWLFRRPANAHTFFVIQHHAVTDGWSFRVLRRDLAMFYRQDRPDALAPLPITYADFAAWQHRQLRGARLAHHVAVWRDKLAGAPESLALPTDRPVPAVRRRAGGRLVRQLAPELLSAFETLGRHHASSLYMQLASAFAITLARFSGQNELLFGMPIAGRERPELEEILGCFVNTLPIRTRSTGQHTFAEVLADVRGQALTAFAHQGFRLEKLVEELRAKRHFQHNPLFQVICQLHNEPTWKIGESGLDFTPRDLWNGKAQFDLILNLYPESQGVRAVWLYDAELFDRTTVERLTTAYESLLRTVTEAPDQPFAHLPLLSPAMRHQMLMEWNDRAPAPVPRDTSANKVPIPFSSWRDVSLWTLFAAQVASCPDAIAVSTENAAQLSYRELERQATTVAARLQAAGVARGDRVGLLFDRHLEILPALLGVLRVGAAYVPIETSWPEDRIRFVTENAQLAALLCDETNQDIATGFGVDGLGIDGLTAATSSGFELTSPLPTAEDAAYMIYTSGSTGQPKGVVVEHRQVTRLFSATQDWFNFDQEDAWTLFHSSAFDLSVWEVWGALAYGGTLVVISKETSRSPRAFRGELTFHRITVLTQTPSAFRQLIHEDARQSSDLALRWVVFAGEAVEFESLRPWFERHPERPALINMYGITETTVHVTFRQIVPADLDATGSLIGQPIPDLPLYLCDRDLRPTPLGAAGEICVAGAGLARGYWRRPALTAGRFVPQPWSAEPGARLYRSGDLARYLPDGDLDYLGRIDHQVKVRGFRIELGEIENALLAHPALREVVVLARELAGETALVAYGVPNESTVSNESKNLTIGDLQRFLSQSLPQYMVPSALVLLDALPLTVNGKIDRRALPDPGKARVLDHAFRAPSTPLEAWLCEQWREVLEVEQVGVDDDFFELGGHSIKGAVLINRLQDALGEIIHVVTIFDAPTVALMTRHLESEYPQAVARLIGGLRVEVASEAKIQSRVAAGETRLPLSFAQERLWFLDRFDTASSVYNVPLALRLAGPLDLKALRGSLDALVARHAVLRTTFAVEVADASRSSAAPMQRIAPVEHRPVWPWVDLRDLDEDRREAERQRLMLAEAERRFDLENDFPIRAVLTQTAEDHHTLILTWHHIASDGWSIGIFLREWTALYRAHSRGEAEELPALPIQYADFAVWQRLYLSGARLDEQIDYWRDHLAGAPERLDLPLDRPRPPRQTFRGSSHQLPLPVAVENGLDQLCRERGVTPFMVLLATFEVLIARLSGERDFVIGSTVAGRTRPEIESLMGFFVNTLPWRARLSGDPTFLDLLGELRAAARDHFARQELPFEKLVEALKLPRRLTHAPLVQVLFQVQNAPQTTFELEGLQVEAVEVMSTTSKFDLVLNLASTPDGLETVWHFNRDLFDSTTVRRWSEHLLNLLARLIEAPRTSLSRLSELAPSMRHQLLLEWNRLEWNRRSPEGGALSSDSLWTRFAARVAERPDALATADEGAAQLSYGALKSRAEGVAARLQATGVTRGDRVGLLFDRQLELLPALLGVLRSGAAYVPIETSWPEDRVRFVAEDAKLAALLGEVSSDQPGRDLVAQLNIETLTVQMETVASNSVEPSNLPPAAEDAAYMIYTSGSTGQPKGVTVEHRQVIRLLDTTQPWFGFDDDDVWTLFHSYAFDFSVWELWGALAYGGRLVMVSKETSRSPRTFRENLSRQRVTVLNQTPSAFRQLIHEDARNPSGLALRWVLFGGEALELETLRPWFERHQEQPALVNLYGITETTVHVTFRRLVAADLDAIGSRIGQPIPDLRLYLCDRDLRPAPLGTAGEICVAGAGLARGYWQRPALTAERFVPQPWSEEPGARLYRSGDLARYLPDGDLDHLGRIDHQVKVRGFRIELGEIENALLTHPALREVVVLARELAGETALVAYAVLNENKNLTIGDLQRFLGQSLPPYMVPAALVLLDALPLTVNGKIDRRALPDPGETRELDRVFRAPSTPLEAWLCEQWREVLGVEQIGVDDDFFELGGQSIKGAVLINRLQDALGEIIHVVTLFDSPTVALLADYLEQQHKHAVQAFFGAQVEIDTRLNEEIERIDKAELTRFRALVTPLAPREVVAKNPRAILVLAPPRSGTTLLRVMLGGHPQLFAPPELELLSFNSLGERAQAFSGRDRFWREGAVRALMEALDLDAEGAEAKLAEAEAADQSTETFYRQLQEAIGDRLLVDKTPSYALDRRILERAEALFDQPFYLHLARHPYGMIRSFEEAKLDQLFFRKEHPFSRRELAELIWTASHENILGFLEGVPAHRQMRIRFEDLVRDPESLMRRFCEALGLDFAPGMLDPYAEPESETSSRMVDGPHRESRMLGDVKFLGYRKIDPSVAERWRQAYREDFLGDPTWEVATPFDYEALHRPLTAIPTQVADGARDLPLSFAQERLWFLDQLEPGATAYNIATAFEIVGDLNLDALGGALDEVVRRHAILRTAFRARKGQPRQMIEPARRAIWPLIDLSALPIAVAKAQSQAIRRAEEARPFDLGQSKLLRARLIRVVPGRFELILVMHHIASDGWSMTLLLDELGEIYQALSRGETPELNALKVQYADYASWQRRYLAGWNLARQINAWRRLLDGLPPSLELPTDHRRPLVRSERGGVVDVRFAGTLGEDLERLAQTRGATLFMALLTLFGAFLQRLTRQQHLAIGSPTANRGRREIEPLIGFFVNTLVLPVRDPRRASFLSRLGNTRDIVRQAFAHQEVPFEKLVEALQPARHRGMTPLFQVFFALQNANDLSLPGARPARGISSPLLPGLDGQRLPRLTQPAKFDLLLAVGPSDEGLVGGLGYSLDLFEESTIVRWVRQLEALIRAAVARPDAPIFDLPLLTAAEHHQVAVEPGRWPGDGRPLLDLPLHELFDRQVDARADAIAISFRDPENQHTTAHTGLTYGAVDRASRRLAERLVELGAAPGQLIGLCFEPSFERVISILAVLRTGAAYLPLEPDQPFRRRLFILENARAEILLRGAGVWPEIDTSETRPNSLREVVELRLDASAVAPVERPMPLPSVSPHHLAYAIYTSGSTGTPKGVLIGHHHVVRLFSATDANYGFDEEDVWSLFHSYAFDVSVMEIWGALLHGGRLVVVPFLVSRTPERFDDLLVEERVTVLSQTPSAFGQWRDAVVRAGERDLRRLAIDWIIFAGEPLDPSLLASWFEAADAGDVSGGPASLINMYGTTETTVHVTFREMVREDLRAAHLRPIGPPMSDLETLILDDDMRPVPLGVGGEICIGGPGLAWGYLERPARTALSFVPHPFSHQPGARLYRAGDLARRLPSGEVEFLGRRDAQIQLRGFRVEPGEVEALLGRHPLLFRAVVVVRDDGPLGLRLAAYAVPKTPDLTVAELRDALAEQLPVYMIPASIELLDALPLTPNGKIARPVLRERPSPEQRDEQYRAPRNALEQQMAEIWREVLGTETVGIDDNFFHLGGHSLLATQLISRLRDELSLGITLAHLFDRPTIAELASQFWHDTEGDLADLLDELDSLSEEEVLALLGDE